MGNLWCVPGISGLQVRPDLIGWRDGPMASRAKYFRHKVGPSFGTIGQRPVEIPEDHPAGGFRVAHRSSSQHAVWLQDYLHSRPLSPNPSQPSAVTATASLYLHVANLWVPELRLDGQHHSLLQQTIVAAADHWMLV